MDDDIDHLLICKLVLKKAGYKILGIPGCKEDEFMHIPVIYFTSEADIALLAAEAGADGHLRKPFDSEGLLCVARQYAAT